MKAPAQQLVVKNYDLVNVAVSTVAGKHAFEPAWSPSARVNIFQGQLLLIYYVKTAHGLSSVWTSTCTELLCMHYTALHVRRLISVLY